MSRYTENLLKGPAAGGVAAWGYDRPLQQYFLTIFNKRGNPIENFTTRADIASAIQKYHVPVPDAHRRQMAYDLPF